ncbi:hypothetical protein [Micromonospora chersina]|uniref:hypothetical protein n=1 Tax=Micromonospora chersina TaxID=47854 RepID=UPI00371EC52B
MRVSIGNTLAGWVRAEQALRRLTAVTHGVDVPAALDLLHLTDMAWHDCYGPRELEIPPQVLDEVLLLAHGNLPESIPV